MSSQRGNAERTRTQKYKNKRAFKNDLHDTTGKMKIINQIEVVGCCARCKDILEWKIKYKKYKPLTGPRKCAKCHEKRVKRAYYLLCDICAEESKSCGKCGQNKDITDEIGPTPEEEEKQRIMFQYEVSQLSERQRRAFQRLKDKGEDTGKLGTAALDAAGSDCSSDTGSQSEEEDDTGTDDVHKEDAALGACKPEGEDTNVQVNDEGADLQDEDTQTAALALLSLNSNVERDKNVHFET